MGTKELFDAACAEMRAFDFLRSAPIALPMTR
jgi:hypothetical protein